MADILGADPNDPTSGLEPYAGISTPDFGTGSDGSFFQSLMNSLSGISPSVIAGLLGAAGPAASLIGNLAGGGQGPTQTGSSNQNQQTNQTGSQQTSQTGNQTTGTMGSQSGSSSGFQNTTGSQTGSQSGYSNTTNTPSLDQAGRDAEARLNAMLGGGAGGAQGAFDQGLSMLQALAAGQGAGGAGGATAPNTTPQPAAVTGFPTELPTTYNSGIGNLIKQAFGSFVGDLGSQAITNARGRGFAGGAELLDSAAAPMMGQTLAQVPAMEAKAYLDHVLQAYGLQTQNAAAQNNAGAQALNAATNALGPGVTAYGIDRSANNQQTANMTSLLQALMGPQQMLMQGNTALLNAAPRTTAQNTLTGGTTSQNSLSGTTSGSQNQSQNQSLSNTQSQQQGNTQNQQAGNTMSQGNTSGTSTTPLGTVLGTGLGNLGQGVATGVAAQQARDASANFQNSLLAALGNRNA